MPACPRVTTHPGRPSSSTKNISPLIRRISWLYEPAIKPLIRHICKCHRKQFTFKFLHIFVKFMPKDKIQVGKSQLQWIKIWSNNWVKNLIFKIFFSFQSQKPDATTSWQGWSISSLTQKEITGKNLLTSDHKLHERDEQVNLWWSCLWKLLA